VSFVELQVIPGVRGEPSMMLEDDGGSNVVLWSFLSQHAITAISELLRERKITMKPTNFLTYAIDGAMLSLRLAKQVCCYKRPHWLPVAFSPVSLSATGKG
jgi:hypothetical protein